MTDGLKDELEGIRGLVEKGTISRAYLATNKADFHISVLREIDRINDILRAKGKEPIKLIIDLGDIVE